MEYEAPAGFVRRQGKAVSKSRQRTRLQLYKRSQLTRTFSTHRTIGTGIRKSIFTSKKGNEKSRGFHGSVDSDKTRRYIFTLEGKDMTVSASDPQPVVIPPQARHTFRVDTTHEGPCVIEFTTAISPKSSADRPEEHGGSGKRYATGPSPNKHANKMQSDFFATSISTLMIVGCKAETHRSLSCCYSWTVRRSAWRFRGDQTG